jgi:hypothetical protein
MPRNTSSRHVSDAQIANSAAYIAKLDKSYGAAVYKHETTADVYINLISTDGATFEESGSFFITLSVYIDALTWVSVPRNAQVVVPFSEGRGSLDILSLRGIVDEDGNPVISPDFPDPPITEDEAERLERDGHYLKLVNMPLNTRNRHVTSAQVANSAAFIAKIDKTEGVKVFRRDNSADVDANCSAICLCSFARSAKLPS